MVHSHYICPTSLFSRILLSIPPGLAAQMQRLWNSTLADRPSYASLSTSTPKSQAARLSRWDPRPLLSLPHLFVLVWVLALLWGERWVFRSHVDSCDWGLWERWPEEATPHHLIFIADPQLIDPHSYLGRPWPLDKLTMMQTDNYMKRSYISLQRKLHPDTVFFLGDLFDGGREWKTAHGNSNDPSWMAALRPKYEQSYAETWREKYGEKFWLHEYDRFGRIFYDFWNLAGAEPGPWQRGRKIISTLPGNHDLGVEDISKVDWKNRPSLDLGPDSPELPTILLTHVPLYREPGTPCGPNREHWPPETPPKGQLTPVNPDHRNAISVSKGYQYQNVLSETDSIKLISSIGNVVQVFSGDDHDYCEIIHSPAKNNAREITVKSTSWAMGVRKPGFLMLSMWNPIDAFGAPLHSSHSGHGSAAQTAVTMESHLCLLPDQIGILIRYALLIVFTISMILIRAALTPILHLSPFSPLCPSQSAGEPDNPLLPITKQDLKRDLEDHSPSIHRISKSSTSSTHSNPSLAPRSSAARTRSVSPATGYRLSPSEVCFATPPLINQAGTYSSSRNAKWGDDFRKSTREMERIPHTLLGVIWRETWTSVWRVTWMVVLVYLYLARYG
ncbi:cdc1-like protein [Diplocarpon rosae]|nr:cdc1-like protein [Diplocarpon rosae]